MSAQITLEKAGVPMHTALEPEECERMKIFLGALALAHERHGVRPGVFIAHYRKLTCGYHKRHYAAEIKRDKAVELRLKENMSAKEIGEILGISTSWARVHVKHLPRLG